MSAGIHAFGGYVPRLRLQRRAIAEALNIAGAMGTLDVAGSQRAGTSALITACRIAGGGGGGPVLVTSAEKRRRPDTDYHRYLGINDLVALEHGLRSESDRQTGLTTLYRNREMVLGLVGGKCSKCGTLQFPQSNVCVNPNCHAADTQEDHSFSDMRATMRSYTADRLTYSVAPPAYYGMVQFEEGGRAMIDFTDIDADAELSVGESMRMVFRVKDYDTRRGFRRYFWKAAPVDEHAEEGG